MRTPKEARKTWCPFSRVLNLELADDAQKQYADDLGDVPVVSEASPHNRIVTEDDGLEERQFGVKGACCIADECSQWVWAEWGEQENKGFCGRNIGMALKVFGGKL